MGFVFCYPVEWISDFRLTFERSKVNFNVPALTVNLMDLFRGAVY